MKMLKKGQKGFTLIELLIVVAIIGILAAIAIPQFAAYRQRAFNGSAQSDLRNIKTAQESLFADNNTYGITELAALNAVAAASAGGGVLTGPRGAATATAVGAALAGSTVQDRVVGIGIALSNGVSASSYTEDAGPANGLAAGSYLMYAKHTQGTRGFAVESENTGIFMVENPLFVAQVLSIGAANNVAGPVASTTGLDITSGTTAGGGAPTAAWFLM